MIRIELARHRLTLIIRKKQISVVFCQHHIDTNRYFLCLALRIIFSAANCRFHGIIYLKLKKNCPKHVNSTFWIFSSDSQYNKLGLLLLLFFAESILFRSATIWTYQKCFLLHSFLQSLILPLSLSLLFFRSVFGYALYLFHILICHRYSSRPPISESTRNIIKTDSVGS